MPKVREIPIQYFIEINRKSDCFHMSVVVATSYNLPGAFVKNFNEMSLSSRGDFSVAIYEHLVLATLTRADCSFVIVG